MPSLCFRGNRWFILLPASRTRFLTTDASDDTEGLNGGEQSVFSVLSVVPFFLPPTGRGFLPQMPQMAQRGKNGGGKSVVSVLV